MRVLVDEKRLEWDEAWSITVQTFGYTNHTLLAEALERWPVSLLERLLPRHLQLIFEINHRFLRQVQIRYPFDGERLARLSIFEEGPEKYVRMTHLAVIGSHSVNGVAKLHTDLLRNEVLQEMAGIFPERFNNKTNGVSPRRWLLLCNPRLAKLITARIGKRWITELEQLRELENFVDDTEFLADFRAVKQANKDALAAHIRDLRWVNVDSRGLFDVQVKRLHEYKRQLLNAIQVVSLWIQARRSGGSEIHPRVFIFGGKAAPALPRWLTPRPTSRVFKSCFFPTTESRWPNESCPPPTSRSRFLPPGRKPRGRET